VSCNHRAKLKIHAEAAMRCTRCDSHHHRVRQKQLRHRHELAPAAARVAARAATKPSTEPQHTSLARSQMSTTTRKLFTSVNLGAIPTRPPRSHGSSHPFALHAAWQRTQRPHGRVLRATRLQRRSPDRRGHQHLRLQSRLARSPASSPTRRSPAGARSSLPSTLKVAR
jgi:hypothetical protein